MDTSAIVLAVVAGVPSILAAAFAYRTSNQATKAKVKADEDVNKLSTLKLDAEAFDRSQAFYDKVINAAEKEVDRLQGQIDRLHAQLERVNDQLAREQDVSNTLRNHLRTVQQQVVNMESTVNLLRAQFGPRDPDLRGDTGSAPKPAL
jgi:chromosome segregation ATPase